MLFGGGRRIDFFYFNAKDLTLNLFVTHGRINLSIKLIKMNADP